MPDHSTISRRQARLGKVASYERRTVKPVHLRIDRSGLAVHVGQLRTPPNARASRKRHLAVDEHPSDGGACELTSTRARDRGIVTSEHDHGLGNGRGTSRSGYSRRRKGGETTFHRDKAILGSARRARGLASQRVEVRLGGTILNTMTALGIPDGEMIGCPAGGVTGDAQPSMELCTKARSHDFRVR